MVSYGRYHAAAATSRLHVFLWPPAEQERNKSDHSFAIPEDETRPRPTARGIEGQLFFSRYRDPDPNTVSGSRYAPNFTAYIQRCYSARLKCGGMVARQCQPSLILLAALCIRPNNIPPRLYLVAVVQSCQSNTPTPAYVQIPPPLLRPLTFISFNNTAATSTPSASQEMIG